MPPYLSRETHLGMQRIIMPRCRNSSAMLNLQHELRRPRNSDLRKDENFRVEPHLQATFPATKASDMPSAR